MIDARIQSLLARPLDAAGRVLAKLGVSANALTLAGLGVAVLLIVALMTGHYSWSLALLGLNRLLDGLDGAIARATRRSDLGGYLDSVADYVFYAGVPFGFAFADPAVNALPAAALLASFLLTAVTFLAFAALAAKRGVDPHNTRNKSFHYSAGLMEGTETIVAFVAMLAWPERFSVIAWFFSGLCLLTAAQRSVLALRQFR